MFIIGGAWNPRLHTRTVSQAQSLIRNGVNIYAFGIGPAANARQLEAVASKPSFVFRTKSYGDLDQEKDSLLQSMAFGGRET